MSATINRPYAEVLADTRAALADAGFGIVSEIDIAQTLKNKLGAELEPQVILGACAPQFALRALQAEPSIGLLLPCNVVVRGSGSATIVEMIDPDMMAQVTHNEQMAEIAGDVGSRLRAALDAISSRSA